MGGNAIKNAVRIPASLYEPFVEQVLFQMREAFPEGFFRPVESYASKESFGDLDIVVKNVEKEDLLKYFSSSEIYNNGPVVSIGYVLGGIGDTQTKFQVDFIFVKPEEFTFACNYFDYNDLGNLIGQTAAGIGLKFGHTGLWYRYIVDNELLGEILITRDFRVALGILGYDVSNYHEYRLTPFETLEDIFEFAVSSKYFSVWNYQLENRNHVGRIRDKKRSTYMKFLEWIKGKDLPNTIPDKTLGFIQASKTWPHCALRFTELTLDKLLRDKAKQKFNGDIVRDLTGLEYKELGDFMGYIRSQSNSAKEFYKLVTSLSDENVYKMIVDNYEVYKVSKSIT